MMTCANSPTSSARSLMRTLTSHSRALLRASAAVLATVVLNGCEAPPASGNAGDQPIAADLVAAHNARLERIDQVESSGQLDLTWFDDDGEHFEFVNIHLFIDRPR